MSNLNEAQPWVITTIEGQSIAFPASDVVEMVPLPTVRRPPGLPAGVRGVVDLRSRVLPLVSLRAVSDLPSADEARHEMLTLLAARRADHERWLDELTAAVRERREFRLTTDPTQCAFGKWYATYESPNHLVRSVLQRFDAPHRAIHASAAEVLSMASHGDIEGALFKIDSQRHTSLHRLIELFAQAEWAVRESLNEIGMVVEHDSVRFAVSVDQVDTLEPLKLETTVESLGFANLAYLAGVGRSRDGRMVVLADVAALWRRATGQA